jgi:hypothetical protein
MQKIKSYILLKFGITETALRSKSRENNDARLEFVKLAAQAGYFDKQIAHEINRSRSAVSRMAKKVT